MNRTFRFFSTILVIVCLSLIWVGCSDTIEIYDPNTSLDTEVGAAAAFFPVDQGYKTTFVESYSTGGSSNVSYKIGTTVDLKGLTVYQWIKNSPSGIDTSFVYVTDNAVYLFNDINSASEKVIEMPMSPGQTWSMADNISDDKSTDITISTDIIIKYDTLGGGVISLKDYPIASALTMTVESVEALNLSAGAYYSGAVKVSTSEGDTKNYYWFVEGIGLVRYAIDVNDSNYPFGSYYGELVSYGK